MRTRLSLRPASGPASRLLATTLAVAALGLGGLVAAPVASAVTPTGRIVITEWMYNSSTGDGSEFAEFTNVGTAPVDLGGWSFDDSHRGSKAKLDLAPLGTVAAGESFVLTDITPAAFRADWSLPDSVKVLQNTVDGLGNGDEIDIWDKDGALQDRLTYPGDKKTDNVSAWVPEADLGAGRTSPDGSTDPTANATAAAGSTVGDASGAWTAKDGSVGSPGLSQFGSNFRFARIDEVTSKGDDTVELANTSSVPLDLTGWTYSDSDHAPAALPANISATTIPAHGYVTFDSTAFGLGGDDAVKLYLPDATTLVDDADWPDGGADVSWARCPDGLGAFESVSTPTFGSANTCGSGPVETNPVRINEVDSDTDTVELVNTGDTAAGISTWEESDSAHDPVAFDDPRVAGTSFALSATTIPAHGYVTFTSLDGLGKDGDAIKLFLADGTTLVDSATWTAGEAEPGSFARCPDGTGDFLHVAASSYGVANTTACKTPYAAACGTEAPTGTGPAIAGGVAWPGTQDWTTADDACAFRTALSDQDVSGLVFDPTDPDVLWAAKNKSHLYRLVRSGGLWVPDTANGWSAGKDIVFPNGEGQPDDEGITVGADGELYVTTERDNANNDVPLDTVLRFDPTVSGTTLTPDAEWNITADLHLTAADANLGFEGITSVPDAALTSLGFVDQSTHAAYDPASYPGHGDGLFFLAVEKTGHVLAYALSPGGAAHQVADIATGSTIAETQWDPDSKRLWAIADNSSSGSTTLLKVDAAGAFVVDRVYDRPTGLPNLNLEGFAIAPSSTCVDGEKKVVRSDDGNNGGHSLWTGTIDCDLGLDAAVSLSTGSVAAGSTLTVSATGLTPGNGYDVILHSTPTTLASGTAGPGGALTLTVTIPAGTTPGAHTIGIASAANPGTPFASAALTVRAAGSTSALAVTGLSAQPYVALGGMLLALGAALALAARVRRRA